MSDPIPTLRKHALKILRSAIVTLVVLSIAGTIYLSGFSTAFLTCTPYLLFFWSAFIAKREIVLACMIPVLIGVAVFGLKTYYEAFWIHTHGEMDALALLYAPAIQSVIGVAIFLIAIADRFLRKKINAAEMPVS